MSAQPINPYEQLSNDAYAYVYALPTTDTAGKLGIKHIAVNPQGNGAIMKNNYPGPPLNRPARLLKLPVQ